MYVVSAEGGVPRRLTWEPTGNYAAGWTADGKDVLFASMHASYSDFFRLFRTHADGTGTPVVLPLPSAVTGTFSADGNTLAYVPVLQWEAAWKHYRGGQTTPVWLVDMKTLDLVKVPRENSNDSSPVWEGDTVYFLSDRNGPVSLFSYDTKTKAVEQVVENHGYDLKTVAPGRAPSSTSSSARCTFMTWPRIRSTPYRLPSMETCRPSLRILPKSPPRRRRTSTFPRQGCAWSWRRTATSLPCPAEKGDTRNLTKTPGSAERDPAWSPDGKSVAYFSDASGEYQLYIRDQDGLQPPKVIDLGPDPSFFYSPRWSPDSKHIAFSDKHLRLWYVDAAGGKPVKIDTGLRGSFGPSTELSWSPDSQWIAYRRDLENQLHAIFFYSLATHTSTQITDGMSDAAHPVFDPGGKYVYFTGLDQ